MSTCHRQTLPVSRNFLTIRCVVVLFSTSLSGYTLLNASRTAANYFNCEVMFENKHIFFSKSSSKLPFRPLLFGVMWLRPYCLEDRIFSEHCACGTDSRSVSGNENKKFVTPPEIEPVSSSSSRVTILTVLSYLLPPWHTLRDSAEA
jgi:hypothetical protein